MTNETTNRQSLPPRIDSLTGIRFFAAIAVVLYHYWPEFVPSVPRPSVVSDGFMGVSLFYVLSGFIIGFVYLRGPAPIIDRKKFYLARFARVYPAYALSFVLQLPLIIWIIIRSPSPLRRFAIATGTLLAHLALMHAWWPGLDWRWNPPSWSLCVEAVFYIAFPLVALRANRVRRFSTLMLLLVCSSLVMLLAPAILVHRGIGWNEQPRPAAFLFVAFAPLCRMPEFMIGLYAALAYKRAQAAWKPSQVQLCGAVATCVGLIGLVTIVAFSSRIPFILRYDGIADLPFVALILGLASCQSVVARVMAHPMIVLLGEASYSVYIFQAPIVDYFRLVSVRIAGQTVAIHVLVFLTYLLVLIGFSLLCFRFFETPLRIFIVDRFHRGGAPRESLKPASGHEHSPAGRALEEESANA